MAYKKRNSYKHVQDSNTPHAAWLCSDAGGAAAVGPAPAGTAFTAGSTQQVHDGGLQSIAQLVEVAVALHAGSGTAHTSLQAQPAQRQAVQLQLPQQQQQHRHLECATGQHMDAHGQAGSSTTVQQQVAALMRLQQTLSKATLPAEDAAGNRDGTDVDADYLRHQMATTKRLYEQQQQQLQQLEHERSGITQLRSQQPDALQQQPIKQLQQQWGSAAAQPAAPSTWDAAATSAAANQASGLADALAAVAHVYGLQTEGLTAAAAAAPFPARQQAVQRPAAGFPKQPMQHRAPPAAHAAVAGAGSLDGFQPAPSARPPSFDSGGAPARNSQPAAAAAAAAAGYDYSSTGKDSARLWPAGGSAEAPHWQQQQQAVPRCRQQQRRRRHRAQAASDEDSDYSAADDEEDSADYELSEEGGCYDEHGRQQPYGPALRSSNATAPAGAGVMAAAGGSDGMRSPQLPLLSKSQRWSAAEHTKLVELVVKHGLRNWAAVAAELPGRNGKQCRERYLTHTAKAKKGNWTMAEEYRLASLHSEIGNKWVQIATQMPGRSDNCLKNHWSAVQRSKRLQTDRGTSGSGSTFLWWYIQQLHQGVPPPDALEAAVAAVPECEKHLLTDEGEQQQQQQQQDELPTPDTQQQQQGWAQPAAVRAASTPAEAEGQDCGGRQSPNASIRNAVQALAAAAAMMAAAAASAEACGKGLPQPAVDALTAAAAAVARSAVETDSAGAAAPDAAAATAAGGGVTLQPAAAAVAAANAVVAQQAAAAGALADELAAAAAAAADEGAQLGHGAELDMPDVLHIQQQQMGMHHHVATAQMLPPAAAANVSNILQQQQQQEEEVSDHPDDPVAAAAQASGPAELVRAQHGQPEVGACNAAAEPAAALGADLQQALNDAHAAAAAGNARSSVAALFAATDLATHRTSSYSPQPKQQQQLDSGVDWMWCGGSSKDRAAAAAGAVPLISQRVPMSAGAAAGPDGRPGQQQRQHKRLCQLAIGALASAENRSHACADGSGLAARRSRQQALGEMLAQQQRTDGGGLAVDDGGAPRTAYPTFQQQQQEQRELWQQQEARWQQQQQQYEEEEEDEDESWEDHPAYDLSAETHAAANACAAAVVPGFRDARSGAAADTPSSFQAPQAPAAAVAEAAAPAPAPAAAADAGDVPRMGLSQAEKSRVLLHTMRQLQLLPANAAAGMQLIISMVIPPDDAPEAPAAAQVATGAASGLQRSCSGSSDSSESRDNSARLRISIVDSAAAAVQHSTMRGTAGRPAMQVQVLAGAGTAAAAAAAGAAGSTSKSAGASQQQAVQPAAGSKRPASVALHGSVLSAMPAAKRVLHNAPPWMGGGQ